MPKVGKIFADQRSPAYECEVIDLSAGGACLYVHGQAPIPRKFTFLHAGTRKSSRLVWERGRKIGIQF